MRLSITGVPGHVFGVSGACISDHVLKCAHLSFHGGIKSESLSSALRMNRQLVSPLSVKNLSQTSPCQVQRSRLMAASTRSCFLRCTTLSKFGRLRRQKLTQLVISNCHAHMFLQGSHLRVLLHTCGKSFVESQK